MVTTHPRAAVGAISARKIGTTEEAIPRWTAIDSIPWKRMWEDDHHWLPHMLGGRKFLGRFTFEGESMLWCEMLMDGAAEAQWQIA